MLIQAHGGGVPYRWQHLGLKLMEFLGQNLCCTAASVHLVLLVLPSALPQCPWPTVALVPRFPNSSPCARGEGESCPKEKWGPADCSPCPGQSKSCARIIFPSCQWRQRAIYAGKAKVMLCSMHCFHSHEQVWFLFGVFHGALVNIFYCKSWRLSFTAVSLGGDFEGTNASKCLLSFESQQELHI